MTDRERDARNHFGLGRALAVGLVFVALVLAMLWGRSRGEPSSDQPSSAKRPTAPAKVACKGGGPAAFSCIVSSNVERAAIPCAKLEVTCPDGVHVAQRCGTEPIEPFGTGGLVFELRDFRPPFSLATGKCTKLAIPKRDIQMR